MKSNEKTVKWGKYENKMPKWEIMKSTLVNKLVRKALTSWQPVDERHISYDQLKKTGSNFSGLLLLFLILLLEKMSLICCR